MDTECIAILTIFEKNRQDILETFHLPLDTYIEWHGTDHAQIENRGFSLYKGQWKEVCPECYDSGIAGNNYTCPTCDANCCCCCCCCTCEK